MYLYIVRHGDPDYATDSLTELGKKQAEAVGRRLYKSGVTEIYSSPNGRAVATAKPLCDSIGKEPIIKMAFSEDFAYGHFYYLDSKGMHWSFEKRAEILGNDTVFRSPDAFSHGIYADEQLAQEGYAELCDECDGLLTELGYKRTGVGNGYEAISPNDKKVAVFCHEGAGLHLLSRILGFSPLTLPATFDFGHTGVTIIQFSGEGVVFPRCLCLSDLSHIYAEGLPMTYNNYFEI